MTIGLEEGARCNRHGCKGILRYSLPENCSCHSVHVPPCPSCTNCYLYCESCAWQETLPHIDYYETPTITHPFDPSIFVDFKKSKVNKATPAKPKKSGFSCMLFGDDD